MLVNITHDTRQEHRRLLIAGIAFLAGMLLLAWLSIAIYDKKFVKVTMITVKAERAGLQLAKFGDVRLHGVLVGNVREITQDGEGASIQVALEPEAAKSIPDNISVEILPTTLFGQKYLALIDPPQPSVRAIRAGHVIPASRVSTNVELSQILADLFPLLRSIRPADLSTTLTAIASGLSGRGEQLGETLDDLDAYLTRMNQELPTLRTDLELLAKVAKTYSLAAPDLVRLLSNATTTARTVSTMETQLNGFLTGVATLSRTGTRVLSENEQAIYRAGKLARPLLSMLDTYSPEFSCLFKGTARYSVPLNKIFEGGSVAQTMDLNAKQRPPYDANDRPEYGDIGAGPNCHGLPTPVVPAGPFSFNDGSDQEDLQ